MLCIIPSVRSSIFINCLTMPGLKHGSMGTNCSDKTHAAFAR